MRAEWGGSSGSDGPIVRAPEGSKGQGSYVDGPRKSFAGGAGLTSTARDYAHFPSDWYTAVENFG